MNNTKILVTGGAGFVGSNLILEILKKFKPKEIIIIDNLISSESINIVKDTKVRFIYGSIADDRIINKLPLDLDYVFHLSCFHGNQSSIFDPIKDHQNNSITSLKLFEWLQKVKTLKKVVYAAAGCAVAEKKYGKASATIEEAPVSLFHDSPYSISKLIGELYGNYYFKQYNFPFVKARFQNIYGPREYLGAGIWRGTIHTVWRNVIPTFIWKAIHGDDLFLDNQGKSSRDFIFVEDITKGLLLCAEKGICGEAYNLASGVETQIDDLASHIIKLTNSKSEVILGPKRMWDESGNRFGDPSKSLKELNFKAKLSIEDGLKKTISWTYDNIEIIDKIMRKHNYFSNLG